jgi:antitoxin HicB
MRFNSCVSLKAVSKAMQQIYKLPLLLEPQPEGGYTITCPLLPELITEADILDDIVPNVSDALAVVIEIYEDMDKSWPANLQPLQPNIPLFAEFLISLTNH